MKMPIKTALLIVVVIMTLSSTSCNNKKQKVEEVKDLPQYSYVTAIENKNQEDDAFRVENKSLYKIGNVENILDMVYNVNNSTFVYSVSTQNKETFNENKIEIIKNKQKVELEDFYSAKDLRLNIYGDKLAFRTFKSQSITSAEGMKIYDINDRRYLQLKSKVLVSGDLYQWIDENKIIYYGNIEGEKSSSKIYVYDFTRDKEDIYIENIKGYCMYFALIDNNVLILTKQGENTALSYYDSAKNSIQYIDSNIEDIYSSVVNKSNGDVYLLGSGDEGKVSLYRFSHNKFQIERLTYDFPNIIDENSGIAMDTKGNIYFCGTDNLDGNDKKDVFLYDINERSINLISTHEGKYNLYNDVKLNNM
ncbi:hypothetical protein [Clostridium sp. DJ247]|uniref:hypothetical protein n=1 Tax=Clostridium sp. DJ247 TaxID=2726188 RepID=UPI001627234A|nr:hypothetical protein [Clostridium sp. DJ247]MBC2580305.1 hypothetical protein [Clostridium sp. DJ247]